MVGLAENFGSEARSKKSEIDDANSQHSAKHRLHSSERLPRPPRSSGTSVVQKSVQGHERVTSNVNRMKGEKNTGHPTLCHDD